MGCEREGNGEGGVGGKAEGEDDVAGRGDGRWEMVGVGGGVQGCQVKCKKYAGG